VPRRPFCGPSAAVRTPRSSTRDGPEQPTRRRQSNVVAINDNLSVRLTRLMNDRDRCRSRWRRLTDDREGDTRTSLDSYVATGPACDAQSRDRAGRLGPVITRQISTGMRTGCPQVLQHCPLGITAYR
jgi:hypothetical protein